MQKRLPKRMRNSRNQKKTGHGEVNRAGLMRNYRLIGYAKPGPTGSGDSEHDASLSRVILKCKPHSTTSHLAQVLKSFKKDFEKRRIC
jgi:hypothetical protein